MYLSICSHLRRWRRLPDDTCCICWLVSLWSRVWSGRMLLVYW